jgi:hypothetical protein
MKYYSIRKYLPHALERTLRVIRNPRHHAALCIKDWTGRFGAHHYPHHILFIAGLPKSGTTWIENFLYHVPGYVPRMLGGRVEDLVRHELSPTAFSHFPKTSYSFVKTHTNPNRQNFQIIEAAGIHRTLITVRDPRDVALSRYHYLLKHPKDPSEPNVFDYAAVSESEGYEHSARIVLAHYVPWMQGWLTRAEEKPEEHLVLRYEDILADPARQFLKISSFFELSLDPVTVESLLDQVNKKMKSNSARSTNVVGLKSTFRSGRAGDWRTLLSSTLSAEFEENARPILTALDYLADEPAEREKSGA